MPPMGVWMLNCVLLNCLCVLGVWRLVVKFWWGVLWVDGGFVLCTAGLGGVGFSKWNYYFMGRLWELLFLAAMCDI
jgi:hypothetical protein